MTFIKYVIIMLFGLSLIGCATTASKDKRDPFETFNRHAYHLNKAIDTVILTPAATIYNGVVPWPARKGISNFFSNLNEVPTFVNNLLQANPKAAYATFWRFAINSTLGIGGLFDVATKLGLPQRREDFGLTLAKWGDKHSPYLVLPILGPLTVRDAFAKPFDYLFSIYPHVPVNPRNYMYATNIVNLRASLLEVQGVVDEAALDPYTFEKNAYLQHRDSLIKQNKVPYLANDMASVDQDDASGAASDSTQAKPGVKQPLHDPDDPFVSAHASPHVPTKAKRISDNHAKKQLNKESYALA